MTSRKDFAGRPGAELRAALEFLRPGDTLVVPALNRLSRSLQDLITTDSSGYGPFDVSACFGYKGIMASPFGTGIHTECCGNNHGYINETIRGRTVSAAFGPGTTRPTINWSHYGAVLINSWTGNGGQVLVPQGIDQAGHRNTTAIPSSSTARTFRSRGPPSVSRHVSRPAPARTSRSPRIRNSTSAMPLSHAPGPVTRKTVTTRLRLIERRAIRTGDEMGTDRGQTGDRQPEACHTAETGRSRKGARNAGPVGSTSTSSTPTPCSQVTR